MERNNRRCNGGVWRSRLDRQMKIVVVCAGQRLRRHVEPIKFKRELFRFGFCSWLTNPFFQQHARNLTSERQNRERKSGVGSCDYKAFRVTGPFTVVRRMTGVPSPYSMRRLSLSSNVLRALAQTLAWQVTGECPRDSSTKLVFSSDGTLSEIGPFTASATKPPPVQSGLCNATLIGPFSVCSFNFPLLPDMEIGPFCELRSAS